MTNILEDGENIEVTLDVSPPTFNNHDVDFSTGRAGSDDPPQTSSQSPPPEISKVLNRTRSRIPFPFWQTKTVTQEAAAAPSSSDPGAKEERDLDMFFARRRESPQAHLFEEAEPELLPSEVDSDEQSLIEAETAETLLGSALRRAEEGIGGNVLSLVKSPRDEAIELGRRVSTLSDIRDANGVVRSSSLLTDDGTVHTWGSQATETTFIKVPKRDPASITAQTWDEIIGATFTVGQIDGEVDGEVQYGPMGDILLKNDQIEDVPVVNETTVKAKTKREVKSAVVHQALGRAEDVPIVDETTVLAKTPPRTKREVNHPRTNREVPPTVVLQALGPAKDRRWDKLRSTLEAQERGASVGYEFQFDSRRRKKSESPQRSKLSGKGLQSLIFQKRTSTPEATKGIPPDQSGRSCEALSPMESAPSSFPETIVAKTPLTVDSPKPKVKKHLSSVNKSKESVNKPKERVNRSKLWFPKPRKSFHKSFDVSIEVEDLSKIRYESKFDASTQTEC